MFRVINVSKIVNNKIILNNVSFELPETGLVLIKGPNGAGKSTILNLLGALDKPTNGNIYFYDTNLTELDEFKLEKYREQNVSFVFQKYNLFEEMTVYDNITIVGKSDNFNEVVNFLGLSEILNVKVKKLSGGEKQRVAIARNLMKNSKILLADEPTSSLDYDTKQKIFLLLKKLSEKKLVILISHDLELINNIPDIVLELNNGNLINVTNNKQIYSTNQYPLYRNKFNSIHFALSNLFKNKKKLILSIIMLAFTFIFLWSFLSLASLDYKKLHYDTMKLENDSTIIFNKNELINGSYSSTNKFDDSDLSTLENMTGTKLIKGNAIFDNGEILSPKIKYDTNDTNPYYSHILLTKYSFIDITNLKEIDYGRKAVNSDEIVISSYVAEQIIRYGILDNSNEYYYPKSFDAIINDGRSISLSANNNVKIVGIYNIDTSKYTNLNKDYDNLPIKIQRLYDAMSIYLENVASNIYVDNSFFEYHTNNYSISNTYLLKYSNTNNTYLEKLPILVDNSTLLTDVNNIKINQGEIVINNKILEELNLGDDYLNKTIELDIVNSLGNISEKTLNLKVVGLSNTDNYYVNVNDFINYLNPDNYINKVFINEKDFNKIKNIINEFSLENNKYTITTNYSDAIIGLNNVINFLYNIFIAIIIIFAIISIFIVINYEMDSIDRHIKDIALLKCFGINENIISFIFIVEILFLLIISYIISFLLFIGIRYFGNNIASDILAIKINILPIYIKYILMVLIFILIFVILIAYFIRKRIEKSSPQTIFKAN